MTMDQWVKPDLAEDARQADAAYRAAERQVINDREQRIAIIERVIQTFVEESGDLELWTGDNDWFRELAIKIDREIINTRG